MPELVGRGRPVAIYPGRPTVIIGERINPTGRKRLAASLAAGDMALVLEEASRQIAEGADVIDVNVGVPGLDEEALLTEAVLAVQRSIEAPVSIDSAKAGAIAACLLAGRREFGASWRPLVNSVTGEAARLKALLPVVREFGAAVVGLCLDERGIPADASARLGVAERIAEAAKAEGLAAEELIFDPVVTPVGADQYAGRTTCEAARLIRERLGASLTIGASNVSFGLPERDTITRSFVVTAVAYGVNAPIVNPGAPGLVEAVRAADLIAGREAAVSRYLRRYRSTHKPG